MLAKQNRPSDATPGRLLSPKRRYKIYHLYCIIFGGGLQETGCYFYTLLEKG